MPTPPKETMAPLPASASRLQVPHQQPHPRRMPAQASVSLRHAVANARANKESPPTSSMDRSSSNGNSSPSSLKPHVERTSSGESSSAENWFDKSNNDVGKGSGAFGDNEPPFFMRNSSSLETLPDAQVQGSHIGHVSDSLPLQTELLRLGTEGSGTDDFRSVIDDLTVQNKKLKRRLKRYEKLHDSHLKDDKLFEVRIHGLPSEKKRELEDMLRKFASSLGTTGDNAFPSDGYNTLLPMLNKETSNVTLQNPDSAYASMSISGRGSSAVSGSDSKQKGTPRDHLTARQKNIHSYLHDIPVGLLPHQAPANMSERTKKKLVVRKIEQLFAGKGAVGGHHQPLQQQEVSLSAAQADRSAMAAAGQNARVYGAREAQMLARKNTNARKEASSDDITMLGQPKEHLDGRGEKSKLPDSEQRPTQPIDLDPDRAQVPLENIHYMRSMGFSPQHPDVAPEDGHGWIYINFLFNMAQLHTLHVTSNFVRDAMSEVSNKLEVSPDGRKVRWRGGRSVTRTSSSGEATPDTGNSSDMHHGKSPRKRVKLTHGNSSSRSHAQAIGATSARTQENNRHIYTPLFHHKSSVDDSDSSSSEEEDTNDSSEQRWGTLGDSSGVASSAMQPSTHFNITGQKQKKAKRDDGPIIFYNNARFCTDLSGDRRPTANQNVPMYNSIGAFPVGEKRDTDSDAKGRGPLAQASSLPEAMDLDDNPIDKAEELSFPVASPPRASSGTTEQKPIDLEVTGIGGVWPQDNFMLNVETRHAYVDGEDRADDSTTAVSKVVAPRFAGILENSVARNKSRAKMGHEIIDVSVKKLQPSKLPPALAFMAHDDDSTEDTDDEDDDHSPDPHDPSALPPQVSAQPVDFDFGNRYSLSDASDAHEEDDESEDESEDDEVDLLADIRQANPEFVRAQEREYNANMAERLAEEIPAGSSAATAGGGSGFASPASDAAKEDVRQAREALRVRPPLRLRQGSLHDSTAVQGRAGSKARDDESSDDDDDDMSRSRS